MKPINCTYEIKLYSNGDKIAEYQWDELFSPPSAWDGIKGYIEEDKQEYLINKVNLHMSTSDGNVLNFTFQK